MFPPEVEEQRSVCQSPTWEAYDRRKKEKKEEKRKELEKKEEEKRREKEKEKEREQAMNQALEEAWKNAPKPRGRKLSKPPPLSPAVLATQGRSVT
jgi:beta-phosphoglucomutase-like phosphatase (HAD superfamily)